MSETTKPTPGPWKAGTTHGKAMETIYGDGCIVAEVCTSAPEPGEREANAALIVAACNACQTINPENPQAIADALVVAIAEIRSVALWMESSPTRDRLRAALNAIGSPSGWDKV